MWIEFKLTEEVEGDMTDNDACDCSDSWDSCNETHHAMSLGEPIGAQVHGGTECD